MEPGRQFRTSAVTELSKFPEVTITQFVGQLWLMPVSDRLLQMQKILLLRMLLHSNSKGHRKSLEGTSNINLCSKFQHFSGVLQAHSSLQMFFGHLAAKFQCVDGSIATEVQNHLDGSVANATIYVPVHWVNRVFQMSLQLGRHIAGWSTYLYYEYIVVVCMQCLLHRYGR